MAMFIQFNPPASSEGVFVVAGEVWKGDALEVGVVGAVSGIVTVCVSLQSLVSPVQTS